MKLPISPILCALLGICVGCGGPSAGGRSGLRYADGDDEAGFSDRSDYIMRQKERESTQTHTREIPVAPGGSEERAGKQEPARSPEDEALRESPQVVGDNEARLKPGLVLNVAVVVSGEREIEETRKRIQDDGQMVLPLIGRVQAAGMTLQEFESHLHTLYGERFFVNPQVVVEFVLEETEGATSPWGYVTVLGRVKKPGRVSIPPTQDLTVSKAVQEAGGLNTSAKDTGVRITRTSPDGDSEVIRVNLRALGSKGEIANDIVLRPGDVVYVPELFF